MDSTREIISTVAKDYLPQNDVRNFIQSSFIEVLVDKGYKPSQTQARAAVTGDVYETCLQELFEYYYPWIEYERNVLLSDACMGNGQGADFVFYNSERHTKENILAVIEAKGSADRLRWPDGTIQEPSRPGMKRTDTIKKAVCQAYQVKSGLGESTDFYLLTSHKPDSGNGYCILEQANGDIIDLTVETTKQELDYFSEFVKEKMQ